AGRSAAQRRKTRRERLVQSQHPALVQARERDGEQRLGHRREVVEGRGRDALSKSLRPHPRRAYSVAPPVYAEARDTRRRTRGYTRSDNVLVEHAVDRRVLSPHVVFLPRSSAFGKAKVAK